MADRSKGAVADPQGALGIFLVQELFPEVDVVGPRPRDFDDGLSLFGDPGFLWRLPSFEPVLASGDALMIKDKVLVVRELLVFLWKEKLWWMVPAIAVLVLLGAVLFLAQGSALAPFIYTLF